VIAGTAMSPLAAAAGSAGRGALAQAASMASMAGMVNVNARCMGGRAWANSPVSPIARRSRDRLGAGGYTAEFAADTRSTSSAALGGILQVNMTLQLPPGLTRLATPILLTVGQKELGTMKRSARMISAAMLALSLDRIVEHLLHAVTEQNVERLEPIFDEDFPIGSTRNMRTW